MFNAIKTLYYVFNPQILKNMITQGINKQQIEGMIDPILKEMYNPKVVISEDQKNEVKGNAIKIASKFIDIIDSLKNKNIANDVFFENVCNKIDCFCDAFNNLLIEQKGKFIAGSIASIWLSLFDTCLEELENYPADKLFFNYGKQKIQSIIHLRMAHS